MGSEAIFSNIPESWEVTTLGEVCARGKGVIQTGPFGSQLHASDYVPVGIPTIMPKNIGDNRVVEDGISRITEKDAQRLDKYRVRFGDIVYSRRGDVRRRALIRHEQNGWLCGTGSLMVRFGDAPVNSVYASGCGSIFRENWQFTAYLIVTKVIRISQWSITSQKLPVFPF